MKDARTVRTRVSGMLPVLSNDLMTAVMEVLNSLVESAKSSARGYHNPETFITIITIITLIGGKLDLRFAHLK